MLERSVGDEGDRGVMCMYGVEWSVAGGRNARIERISKSTRMQPQSYKRWSSRDCKRVVDGG